MADVELSKSYDYSLQKVKLYTRIPLGDIVGISKGFPPSPPLHKFRIELIFDIFYIRRIYSISTRGV